MIKQNKIQTLVLKYSDQSSARTLENDWKKVLCFGKLDNYWKCPTVLSKEFNKSNSCYTQVKYNKKVTTICIKLSGFIKDVRAGTGFTQWAAIGAPPWTHWDG